MHVFFHAYAGAKLVIAAVVLLFLGLRVFAARFWLPDLFCWRELGLRQVAIGAEANACVSETILSEGRDFKRKLIGLKLGSSCL